VFMVSQLFWLVSESLCHVTVDLKDCVREFEFLCPHRHRRRTDNHAN